MPEEFLTELDALLEKYGVELQANYGYRNGAYKKAWITIKSNGSSYEIEHRGSYDKSAYT